MSPEPLPGGPQPDPADAAFAGGERVVASASSRLDLAPAGHAWLLEEGKVELFAQASDGERDAPRRHLASFEPGALLFGAGGEPGRGDGDGVRLLATGVGQAVLRRLGPDDLLPLVRRPEARRRLEAGIAGWVAALGDRVSPREAPEDALALAAGGETTVPDGGAVGADGPLVWLRLLDGRLRWAGEDDLVFEAGDHLLALGGGAWVEAEGEALVSTVGTDSLLASGRLWEELERFHDLFAAALELAVDRVGEEERDRLQRRLELDEQALIGAQAGLASVISSATDQWAARLTSSEPLVDACRLVGEAQGVEIQAPRLDEGDRRHPVAAVAAASRVRYRRVLLRDDWWRRDNGPLVAFLDDGDGPPRPVALIPRSPRSYRLVDPVDGTARPVDRELAEQLVGEAFMFYPPLPDGSIGFFDLFRIAFGGQRRELATIAAVGVAGGLLALLVPILTAQLFGQVIPDADRPQLVRLTLALVVAAVAGALFQITSGVAVLRMGVRIDGVLQAAVWDRLLALPAGFFRGFTVGDLVDRVNGVDSIRQTLSGQMTTALLGAVFSVFSFALLFWYSVSLAWAATGLVAVLLGTSAWLAWLQLRHQRALMRVRGRIASLLYGFFSGLGKLRIAAAEERAYLRWARRFADQRRLTLKAQQAANLQTVLNVVYGVGSLMVIFAVASWELASEEGLAVSDFLAFSAALGQFQAAALTLLSLFSSLLLLKPTYERLRPVLEAEPEVDTASLVADDLEGAIEIGHVSFRYDPEGPLVLEDVSVQARPGEMIALVGPSGSGKSTLLRLLLGFERPTSGSIYFDGQDLASLDPHSVRRQIGVVLQDGAPMTGDIFSNIVGTSGLTIDDAWRAAAMAGLAEDIQEMPMGMHTVISEGAGTLSGGQRQRLLIARALVRRPRILFLDEATSALDNRTQETVSRSLDQLEATRVVVAHRLSTIRHADRIFVLERGRVVESGAYDELVDGEGLFARLVERQTL